jgi:hypothetical protein
MKAGFWPAAAVSPGRAGRDKLSTAHIGHLNIAPFQCQRQELAGEGIHTWRQTGQPIYDRKYPRRSGLPPDKRPYPEAGPSAR